MIFGHVFFPFFLVEKNVAKQRFLSVKSLHHPIHYLSFSPGKQSSSMRKGQRRSGNRRGSFSQGFWWPKKKKWNGSESDRFPTTLCTKKCFFFLPQRVPPTNGGDPWEMVWTCLSSTSSNHFGKIGCKRPYIEYGDVDTGSHQRKRTFSPFSQGVWWQKLNGFKQNSKYGNWSVYKTQFKPVVLDKTLHQVHLYKNCLEIQHEIQPYSMFICVPSHLRN